MAARTQLGLRGAIFRAPVWGSFDREVLGVQQGRPRLRRSRPAPPPPAPVRRGHRREGLHQEIAGVLLVAAGVWLYVALAGFGGGALGDALARGLRVLVGGAAAWVLPALVVALGGALVWQRQGIRLGLPAGGTLILFLVLVTWIEVITYPLLPTGAETPLDAGRGYMDPAVPNRVRGGGFVGYVLGVAVTRLFGTTGRHVILLACAVVGLVLAFGFSVAAGARRLGAGVRAAGGAAAAGAGRVWRLARDRAMATGAALAPRGRAVRPDAVAALTAPRRDRAPGGKGDTGDPGSGDGLAPIPPRRLDAAGGGRPLRVGREVAGALGEVPRPAAGAGGAPAAVPGTAGEPRVLPAASARRAGAGAEGAAGTTDVASLAGGAPDGVRGTAPASGDAGAGDAGGGAAPGAGGGTTAGAGSARGASGGEGAGGGGGASARLPVKLTRQAEGWQMALAPEPGPDGYRLPPITLLRKSTPAAGQADAHQDALAQARLLEEVLATFGVPAKVVEVHQGPAITRFELTVEPGVRVGKVAQLADDLAYHLAARDIRIEAPIPGKRAIGIEVPNRESVSVYLRDVLETPEFAREPSKLAVAFGKDIAGNPIIGVLERMPHLLIAGATGSGKSVCMNTIICSLLMRARPDELKMLMIDPKRVELQVYDGIPHLVAPVCTDPRKAAGYLKWAVREMELRYDLLAKSGTRNITSYNRWVQENPTDEEGKPRQPLPYIVIFIDELSDLMMVAPVEVEDCIIRLAQMARACGIHLVIATQRPSVDVITGLIKANIPSRIAFAVASQVDSRTILDMAGAEKLLGKGDMLYHPQGLSKPIRAQGAYISDKEVEALVAYVKQQGQPVYQAEAMEVEGVGRKGRDAGEAEKESATDAALAQAVRVVIEHGQASVSILQRRLRCNYTKAVRLIDMMYERGWIGPPQGPKPREVLITMPQWEQIFGGEGGAREGEAGEGE